LGHLEYLFALLLAAVLLVRAADLVHVPYPIVLVLAGLGVALVPGLPDLELDPDVILLVFLPPLLMSAGWYSSPRELRAESRALGGLALVLVLGTMAAVALTAHALVDGLPWAAAFVLGAVVAPTDAVAAVATFSRVRVPDRVSRLVQGESLINDATGLTAFKVAVVAATTGTFAIEHALLDFLEAAAGGIVVGLVVTWLGIAVIRKLQDVPVIVVITVLTAYAAYIAGEELDVSGVLAVVTCGIYTGWHQSDFLNADSRLSATAFWRTFTFALETLLFILLGVQFRTVLDAIEGRSWTELVVAGLGVSAVVIAVRGAFALLRLSSSLSRRERIVVGWCGMRGAISLGAALGAPLAMPGRPEVIVLTYAVILVTLVGQGLTLPIVIRALKLPFDREWSPDEAIARLEAAQSALDRLDELESEGRADEDQLRRLRELYRARFQQCMAVLGGEREKALDEARERRGRFGDLRRDVIDTERTALLRLRDEGRVSQDVVRNIERDLDLDEARLR
jgi:Na+/H+ antiporter